MKYIGIILILIWVMSLSSCQDDDPTIVIETVTVHDTITQVVYDTVVVIQMDTIINSVDEDSSVVVICVRHAETTGIGSNPGLSTAGEIRVEVLANALSNITLTSVYSTNFNRTQETAEVTALAQGLSITTYNAFDIPGFSQFILDSHKGQRILVVGHSNTTPDLLNVLSQSNMYSDFHESTYDNLFIAVIKSNGDSRVHHLEYGADTP